MSVRMQFNIETQIPSVSVYILRPEGNWHNAKDYVQFQVYSNSLRGGDHAGIQLYNHAADETEARQSGLNQYFFRIFEHFGNLVELARASNLLGVDMIFGEVRPVFTGLKNGELQAINAKYIAKNTMNTFERIIACLHNSERLAIFRRLSTNGSPALPLRVQVSKFTAFFSACMALAIEYGNWWGYSQQVHDPSGSEHPLYDIHSPECDLSIYHPPRWMVKKWLLEYDSETEILKAVTPYHWNFFSRIFGLSFPSVEDAVFPVRLGLVRERQEQLRLTGRMMNSTKNRHLGLFKGLSRRPGTYLVYIKVRNPIFGELFESLKLHINTRVKIQHRRNCYSGTVIEDVDDPNIGSAEHSWDYTVAVVGPKFDFKDNWQKIEVEMVDDIAANRAKLAVENMAFQEIYRKEGIDLKAFVFNAPTSIPEDKQGTFAARLTQDQLNSSLVAIGRDYRFNGDQKRAAMGLVTSLSGLTILSGPAGTGKTYTLSAMIEQCARHKKKALFVCSSNKAVDFGLTVLRKCSRTVRAIRFVGGLHKLPLDGTDALPWDENFDILANITSTQNSECLYSTRKQETFASWSEDASHPLHAQATEYFAVEDELQQEPGQERRRISERLEKIEKTLLEHFFENEVDAVFVTCSLASYPALADNFRPDVVFIDNAGRDTIADACMALDAYKETVTAVVVAGDLKQLTPVAIAQEANEALLFMERSLLDRLIQDPHKRHDYTELTIQYRTHPDIMVWSSGQFYESALKNDPSTRDMHPEIARTLTALFAQLGPKVWNNRRRMAIDVSSREAFSKKYRDTTSFCNKIEAKYLVALVEHLLEFTPPQGGAPILPEHIGIFSAYKGQLRLIQHMLRSKGLDTTMARVPNEGLLSTTDSIQGGEVMIAFISLCVKDKTSPTARLGFVARESSLCVLNTRAKVFQVTFGNFAGWRKAFDEGATESWRHRSFGDMVYSHYRAGDVVSSWHLDRVFFGIVPRNVKGEFVDENGNVLSKTRKRNLGLMNEDQARRAAANASNS